MTHIVVDMNNPTPPYEQVRREIVEQIRTGELQPGDRLPAIRVLAGDLGLAPGTVARAFKALEEAQMIITRRGAGTTVAAGAEIEARRQLGALRLPAAGAADPTLVELLTAPLEEARARGADEPAILAAVRAVLAHRR
ncbi:GntR family transcriptional regulator [Brachybacterium sp. J144]|uniref:GntR family transcriptional regulator n=1 Tax=Brachybacterium sp. J144 TaxID=3116487 RepID=UPI002E75ADC2|nr:GntR family transcriptional regulator [Brachybacterium sp. J144]MEE1651506.1 GntR family transcriptional regulator [Brachybacterium sp. J144]